MRVIAQNVEYFDLMRDHGALINAPGQSLPESPMEGTSVSGLHADRGLRDSLWYFDGDSVRCWMDVEDLLTSASTENDCELPQPVTIATDFYPTSVMLDRGLVLGLDSEMIQRRDVQFAYLRHTIRVRSSPPEPRKLRFADCCRHNYSCPISYIGICPTSILLPLLSLFFATKICRTSLMLWRFSSTWFLMMRSTPALTRMPR